MRKIIAQKNLENKFKITGSPEMLDGETQGDFEGQASFKASLVNKSLPSITQVKDRENLQKFLETYFEVVYSNCSIFEANIIGLLEFHPRLDSRIPGQLLINQLGKDGDFFILEGNPQEKLVLSGDIRTMLINKNIILKYHQKMF